MANSDNFFGMQPYLEGIISKVDTFLKTSENHATLPNKVIHCDNVHAFILERYFNCGTGSMKDTNSIGMGCFDIYARHANMLIISYLSTISSSNSIKKSVLNELIRVEKLSIKCSLYVLVS